MRHLCSYCSSIFTLSEMVCSFLGRQSESGCCVLHSALHQKHNPEPVWSIPSEYFCRSAEQSSAFNDPRTRTSPQQPGKMLEKSSSAINRGTQRASGHSFLLLLPSEKSAKLQGQNHCKEFFLKHRQAQESSEISPNGKAAVKHSSCGGAGSCSSPVHPVKIPSSCDLPWPLSNTPW